MPGKKPDDVQKTLFWRFKMKMVKSLLLGILPEETWMKPIKGISTETTIDGAGLGITKETGNIIGIEESG